jgi:hypothetical protein
LAISTKLVHCVVMKTAGCMMHPAVVLFELTGFSYFTFSTLNHIGLPSAVTFT